MGVEHVQSDEASGNAGAARRLAARSGDQCCRGADLPDHLLPVRQRRARGEPVRPEGTRQHLHPHHEPHAGRVREARRGGGGRRGGAGARFRPGGVRVLGAEPGARRRQHRQLHRPVWRHLEPVRQHAEGPGHRGALRRSDRPGGVRARHRRPHARLLRRDAAQPEADRLPDRRGRGDRPASSASR